MNVPDMYVSESALSDALEAFLCDPSSISRDALFKFVMRDVEHSLSRLPDHMFGGEAAAAKCKARARSMIVADLMSDALSVSKQPDGSGVSPFSWRLNQFAFDRPPFAVEDLREVEQENLDLIRARSFRRYVAAVVACHLWNATKTDSDRNVRYTFAVNLVLANSSGAVDAACRKIGGSNATVSATKISEWINETLQRPDLYPLTQFIDPKTTKTDERDSRSSPPYMNHQEVFGILRQKAQWLTKPRRDETGRMRYKGHLGTGSLNRPTPSGTDLVEILEDEGEGGRTTLLAEPDDSFEQQHIPSEQRHGSLSIYFWDLAVKSAATATFQQPSKDYLPSYQEFAWMILGGVNHQKKIRGPWSGRSKEFGELWDHIKGLITKYMDLDGNDFVRNRVARPINAVPREELENKLKLFMEQFAGETGPVVTVRNRETSLIPRTPTLWDIFLYIQEEVAELAMVAEPWKPAFSTQPDWLNQSSGQSESNPSSHDVRIWARNRLGEISV